MIVLGAVMPHGGIAVPEAVAPEVAAAAAPVTDAMRAAGRAATEAGVETVLLLSPHSVHVEGHFAVVVSGRVAGALEGAREPVQLDCPTDRGLAGRALDELRSSGLPALGVSFGGNDAAGAVFPMDWATLIPLWFLGGREQRVEVAVVAPCRDLDAGAHLAAGAALARAAGQGGRRVAVVASADQAHTHLESGPYGFHPAAAVHDSTVEAIAGSGSLAGIRDLDPRLVDDARADAWWQMLMLEGALPGWRAELLCNLAPTYFGMLVALLRPPAPTPPAVG